MHHSAYPLFFFSVIIFRGCHPLCAGLSHVVSQLDSLMSLCRCCRSCLVVAVALYFEDVGVMSAAILDIEEDLGLSAFQAEVLVGSLNVIAAFGGLIAGAHDTQ